MFLIVVMVLGIVAMRRQSYFQHRETLRAANPEYMARIEAEERRGRDRFIAIGLIILAGFGFLCLLALSQSFKGFGPDMPKTTASEAQ